MVQDVVKLLSFHTTTSPFKVVEVKVECISWDGRVRLTTMIFLEKAPKG